MVYKIFLFGFFIFWGCKPKTDQSDEKYAVQTDLDKKGTIIALLNKPGAELKVCLINENPSAKVGEKYLDYLEANFREGLYSWLRVAAQHPTWVGPSKPKINFERVAFDQYLGSLDKFRKAANPRVFAKIEALLLEKNNSFEKAMRRYRSIVLGAGLQKKASPYNALGCKSAVSIYGFTAKSKAIQANDLTGDLGELNFLPDDHLRQRVMSYLQELYLARFTDNSAKENMREQIENSRNMMWDRAHVNLKELSITIGMGNIYQDLGESIDVLQALSGSKSFLGKWTMNHEIGHLFFLKDVYIEGGSPSALNRHPNALMGNHWKAEGMIQSDDRTGLFAVLDGLKSGKIVSCANGYQPLDNSIDSRSKGKLYCIPTSDFINQVDIREPDFPKPNQALR